MTAAQTFVVILALISANLPFLSSRIFLFRAPRQGRKSFAWALLELAVLYCIVGLVARGLETSAHGTPYTQHWEFYWTTGFLFLVFGFPGFAARYLWRHRNH